MKYLKSEFPIAIALIILSDGFALEQSAVDYVQIKGTVIAT